MKLLSGSIIIFSFVFAQGCRKACIEDHEQLTTELTSTQSYYIDGTYFKIAYEYNGQGRVTREKQISIEEKLLFESVLHYSGRLLTKEELGISPKIADFNYKYDNNRLIESEYIEYLSGPIRQHFKRSFLYQGSRINKIVETNLEHPELSNYTILSYTGDNITRVIVHDLQTDELKSDVVLDYDNKNNPFFGVKEHMGLAKYSSRNNIIRETVKVKYGSPVNEVSNYGYEYNVHNYPVKKSYITMDGRKLIDETYNYDK